MNLLEIAQETLSYDAETGDFRWTRPQAVWIAAGDIAGSLHKHTGYRYIGIAGKKHKAHRLAWLMTYGELPPSGVDHINGVRHDNRLVNLRLATYAENQQNRKLDVRNKSGYTGVFWSKELKRWRARICVNRKITNLGVFDTPELAHDAYVVAKAKLHTFNPTLRETA